MPRTRPSATGQQRLESAPAARRALRMLEVLASHPDGLRMTDLATVTGLPKSSATLLLGAIVEMGWADRDEQSGTYRIGLRAWQVGQQYLQAKGLVARAQPIMDRVRDRLNETVRLAILDGRDNVYVADSKGSQALALDTNIGQRLPAYATGLGKVLLAALPHDELLRRYEGVVFERFTPNTIGDLETLETKLAVIRRRGWGSDDEEYVLGVRCVAVPITDHRSQVVAALSVSVPSIRFNRNHRKASLLALSEAAEQLSLAVGAPIPAGR
jgi:DNA-binding IclR family transcriptional regulator